jgi:hypothetical protein
MEVHDSAARKLMMDIMRFGPEVEVLGTVELRRSVSIALSKTLSLYKSET